MSNEDWWKVLGGGSCVYVWAYYDEWVLVCMSDVSEVSVWVKDMILGEDGTEWMYLWVSD